MSKRKSLGKKLRFEVFKRDSFTCQYCGSSAPDVVLNVDHIKPISKGGEEDDITNLITSCRDCNSGKGAREIDDDAVVVKQKQQLDDLNERRLQLEMMMEWRQAIKDVESQEVEHIANAFHAALPEFTLNNVGLADARKWLRKYGLVEVLDAIDSAVDQYVVRDENGRATESSAQTIINYIPRICSMRQRYKNEPHLKDVFYIRGIVRNRMHCNEWRCKQLLEEAILSGIDPDRLKSWAIEASSWTRWCDGMYEMIEGAQG